VRPRGLRWNSVGCRSLRSMVSGALGCTLLAACSPGSDLPLLPETDQTAYHLGPGDHVRIIVYGDKDLGGEFEISDRGNLNLPLAGTVLAKGLDTEAIEKEIAGELKQKNLVKDPSVTVEIISYRPIFVLGEVSKPGQYPYQPGMTVLTAVAVAGGFTYRAVEGYAAITRPRSEKAVEGRAPSQAYVEPGDVIRVLERRF
jgi:polysaccharide export outer membrane protein